MTEDRVPPQHRLYGDESEDVGAYQISLPDFDPDFKEPQQSQYVLTDDGESGEEDNGELDEPSESQSRSSTTGLPPVRSDRSLTRASAAYFRKVFSQDGSGFRGVEPSAAPRADRLHHTSTAPTDSSKDAEHFGGRGRKGGDADTATTQALVHEVRLDIQTLDRHTQKGLQDLEAILRAQTSSIHSSVRQLGLRLGDLEDRLKSVGEVAGVLSSMRDDMRLWEEEVLSRSGSLSAALRQVLARVENLERAWSEGVWAGHHRPQQDTAAHSTASTSTNTNPILSSLFAAVMQAGAQSQITPRLFPPPSLVHPVPREFGMVPRPSSSTLPPQPTANVQPHWTGSSSSAGLRPLHTHTDTDRGGQSRSRGRGTSPVGRQEGGASLARVRDVRCRQYDRGERDVWASRQAQSSMPPRAGSSLLRRLGGDRSASSEAGSVLGKCPFSSSDIPDLAQRISSPGGEKHRDVEVRLSSYRWSRFPRCKDQVLELCPAYATLPEQRRPYFMNKYAGPDSDGRTLTMKFRHMDLATSFVEWWQEEASRKGTDVGACVVRPNANRGQ